MTLVVLYGDSMLARFTKTRIDGLESHVGAGSLVLNCAAGGWTSVDGARRVHAVAELDPDVVVLSFGTNDCVPTRRVELEAFAANIQRMIEGFPRAKVLAFLPPSVVEREGEGPRGRTNKELTAYRDVLRNAVGHVRSVETDRALTPLAAAAEPTHVDDLHLTGPAYELVIAALALHIRLALDED
ncbi:SGNH/GDSL hydrolase family protein [Streptomyces sp. NPDC050400]|uniref:SGNH/GDSL hydrolase family protein n=1 Tax=Streptomyces sp. NPDC050400 TaxID=3365610 RepID=UPI0037977435